MNYAEILREVGIKPSITRLRIYEFMIASKWHPTVEEVYLALKDELPTLSKTTVYNTVHLLKSHRLLKAYAMNNQEMRYDANMTMHAHFICKTCHDVKDIEVDVQNQLQYDTEYGTIEDTEVVFYGTCNACQNTVSQ